MGIARRSPLAPAASRHWPSTRACAASPRRSCTPEFAVPGRGYTAAVRIVDLIEKKRDGGRLGREELEALVLGYTRGEVPAYQAAAWLMAVVWRGMAPDEVADLTRVMAASGRQLDLAHLGRPAVDKH